MPRIAIIGGGISGLSAAFVLEEKRQSGVEIDYVLFESAPRLGGVPCIISCRDANSACEFLFAS